MTEKINNQKNNNNENNIFEKWNQVKQKIENKDVKKYCKRKEIWWCSLGKNIGVEMDGKNENFERPCLIMKVYNLESIFVFPITTKNLKKNIYNLNVKLKNKKEEFKQVFIKLNQGRTISNKRLLRKIDKIDNLNFQNIKKRFFEDF